MRSPELLETITNDSTRPLLLAGGTVISMNPMLGDWQQADVLIGGDTIVGVGPGLVTAADDDGMIVIDCTGSVILPARTDFTATGTTGTLTPGERADIAVIRLADPDGTPDGPVVARASHLDILLNGGRLVANGGPTSDGAEPTPADHPFVGLWVDQEGFLRQNLLPDGRYDEARGDRASAYTGRYWVSGTRIDYLDDLGFWAYGEFRDGELRHAGYRLTRH